MIEVDFYSWNCLDLIHSYIGLHFDDFCERFIDGSDISELEYCEDNFTDFYQWAKALGFEVYKERG